MRHLIIAILFLLPFTVSAQLLRSYGVVEIGATFPTSTSTGAKFAYRTTDSSFYRWIVGNTWVKVLPVTAATPDTLYLKQLSGTTALVDGDTIDISTYLLKTDTTYFLNPYIRLAGYGLLKTLHTLTVDTSLVSTKTYTNRFLLKSDTTTAFASYLKRPVGWGLSLLSGKYPFVDSSKVASRYYAGTNPTTIASGYLATSNGNNLVARNLFDNNTYVGILNSKPFALGQWTTAGRPTGTDGYKGRNTTTGFEEGYFTSQWENYITSTGASANQLSYFTSAGKIIGDPNMTFNSTNKTMQVGTNTTTLSALDVVARGGVDGLRLYSLNNPNGGSVNPPSIGFYRTTSSVAGNPRFRIFGTNISSSGSGLDFDGFAFTSPGTPVTWLFGSTNGTFLSSNPLSIGGESANIAGFGVDLYVPKLIAGYDRGASILPVDGYIRSGQKNNTGVNNIPGSNLYFQSGRGTGNGLSTGVLKGDVIFQTPDQNNTIGQEGTLQSQTTKMILKSNGNLLLGKNVYNAINAILNIDDTTKVVIFPRMTTTQRNNIGVSNAIRNFTLGGSTGTGYPNGSYVNIPLTNISGTGTGATVNLTVSGGTVQFGSIVLANSGSGYNVLDKVTVTGASLGGGGSGLILNISQVFTYRGAFIFNTTTGAIEYYDGTTWKSFVTDGFYSSDGSLTSNRTVTGGAFSLTLNTKTTMSDTLLLPLGKIKTNTYAPIMGKNVNWAENGSVMYGENLRKDSTGYGAGANVLVGLNLMQKSRTNGGRFMLFGDNILNGITSAYNVVGMGIQVADQYTGAGSDFFVGGTVVARFATNLDRSVILAPRSFNRTSGVDLNQTVAFGYGHGNSNTSRSSGGTHYGYQQLPVLVDGQQISTYGYQAGRTIKRGTNLSFIGNYTGATDTMFSDASAIGNYAAIGQNQSITIGAINGVNSATYDAKIGIGTVTPDQKFTLIGNARFGSYGTGTREAADLSKTQSNYIAGFATDGTVLDYSLSNLPNGIYTGSGTLAKHTTRARIPSTGNLLFSQTYNSTDSAYIQVINNLDGNREVRLGLTDTVTTGYANLRLFQDEPNESMGFEFRTEDSYGGTTLKGENGGLSMYADNTLEMRGTEIRLNNGEVLMNQYGQGNMKSTDLGVSDSKYVAKFSTNGRVTDYYLARDTFIEDVTLFSVGTLMYECQELTIVSSMTVLAESDQEIRFPDASDALRGKKIIVYIKKKEGGLYLPKIKVVGGVSRLYFTTDPGTGGTDPSDQSELLVDDTNWSYHGATYEFTCLKIDNAPSYRWVLKQR